MVINPIERVYIYTYCKGSYYCKGGRTIPNIGSLDPGTWGVKAGHGRQTSPEDIRLAD